MEKQNEKKTSKNARSKGKSISGQMQTDRKPVRTIISNADNSVLKEDHSKMVINKLERDL